MGIQESVANGMATLARLQQASAAPAAAPLSMDAAMSAANAAMAGGLSGLDGGLADLYFATSGRAGTMAAYLDHSMTLGLAASALSADGRYVAVDVSVKAGADAATLMAQLQGAGLMGGASYAGMVSGELPVAALGQISSLSALGQAHASIAVSEAGSVQSQGVAGERVNLAQTAHPEITGAGQRLGILSTSFDKDPDAVTRAADDIRTGDLPAFAPAQPNLRIIADYTGTVTNAVNDEGRAMAQLAHDVAPGAGIDFATALNSQAVFAANIIKLAQAGDKIIVDDIRYPGELSYQNGPIAQAIETVIRDYGVTYFSSNTNDSNHGWEGAWVNGSSFSFGGANYTNMSFSGQDYLPIRVTNPNTMVAFSLQWDEPGASAGGPGATSDLDVFVYSDAAMTQLVGSVIGSQKGADPVNMFGFTSGNIANQTFYVRVAYNSTLGGGAPPEIRLVSVSDGAGMTIGAPDTNINPGAVLGHKVGGGAIGVGENTYSHTPAYNPTLYPNAQLDMQSGVGFDKVTWSETGVRLATPIYSTPQIVGVDTISTTFFPSRSNPGPYVFNGTSAAAPDVAAVAVLMLQANGALTRNDLLALIQDSALDMDDPYTPGVFDTGFDTATGAGLVQADLAVNFALGGVISNASQTSLAGTQLADTLVGSAAADTLTGGGGDDRLDGGDGVDTAFYSGRITDYTLTHNADGSLTMADNRSGSPDGVDTLRNIERFQFADAAVALPTSVDAVEAAAIRAVLRVDPGSLLASALTASLAASSDAAAVTTIVQAATTTTEVATLSYQFFTGHTPTAAGMDSLVSPTGGNANNLNSSYYAQFSATNRYINFAVNLGKVGEGAAAFRANYGSLSLTDATTKAYTAIFGTAPTADKVSHLLHDLVPNGVGGTYEREDYFASYGQDGLIGLGTKAAMVGFLMGAAATGDVGTYAKSDDAFLTDVANGRATFGVDLVGTYAKPAYAYTGG